jgi:hypothetical protein
MSDKFKPVCRLISVHPDMRGRWTTSWYAAKKRIAYSLALGVAPDLRENRFLNVILARHFD